MNETADIGGLKFYIRTGQDESVLIKGVIENIYGIPEDMVDKVVVDVGAFLGGVSMLAAYRGAVVYAIEPSGDNFRLLRKNIELNGLADSIEPFRMALGQHKGKTRLIDINNTNPASNVLQGLENKVRYQDAVERVRTLTLKEFFTENKIEHCDILKLDCEGAEIELVDDIKELNIDVIVAELHSRFISNTFDELTMYTRVPKEGQEVRFERKATIS